MGWKDTSNHWSRTEKRAEVLAKVLPHLRPDNWKGKKRERYVIDALQKGRLAWRAANPGEYRAVVVRATRWMTGSGNPTWSGGAQSNSRLHTSDWKALKRVITAKWKGHCASCRAKVALVVHHIEPYRISQDNSEQNLIPLCRPCHGFIEQYNYQQYKLAK